MNIKLTASLNLKAQNNQYQFGIEAEVNDQTPAVMATQIHKAITALEIAVNDAMAQKRIGNVPSPSEPKQLPTGAASEGQIKYLNDLTSKCGTTLHKWCQEHGVNKNAITAQHCKEWIPELKQKVDNSFF